MAVQHDFKNIMSKHSDDKLKEVLIKRIGYQPAAVEAAIEEAIKRNLIHDENDLESKYPLTIDSPTNSVENHDSLSHGLDFNKSLNILYLIGIGCSLIIFLMLQRIPVISFGYLGLVFYCSRSFNKTLANIITWIAAIQIVGVFVLMIVFLIKLFL